MLGGMTSNRQQWHQALCAHPRFRVARKQAEGLLAASPCMSVFVFVSKNTCICRPVPARLALPAASPVVGPSLALEGGLSLLGPSHRKGSATKLEGGCVTLAHVRMGLVGACGAADPVAANAMLGCARLGCCAC